MQANRIKDHPKSETRSFSLGECELSGGNGIGCRRGREKMNWSWEECKGERDLRNGEKEGRRSVLNVLCLFSSCTSKTILFQPCFLKLN